MNKQARPPAASAKRAIKKPDKVKELNTTGNLPDVTEQTNALANFTETMISTIDIIEPAVDTNTNNANTAENHGPGGDGNSTVIVKKSKKSLTVSAKKFINLKLTKKLVGKKHSSKSTPEHIGYGGASNSIVMVEKNNKSPSDLLTHTLKTKNLVESHSSTSNPEPNGVVEDSFSIEVVEKTSKSSGASTRQFLQFILKTKKSGKKLSSKSNPELLDFNRIVELGYLTEASQQLLERETCLFSSQPSAEATICTEDEKNALKKDYETLLDHLKMAVCNSFNMENQERLRSAIMAIVHQEERDRLWDEAGEEYPCWRPMKCQQIHDTILKEVVEERLQQVNEEERDIDALKREVLQIGNVIRNDLLHVVNHLQKCYSSDVNVCDVYAQLYHQAFSTKLEKLLQSSNTTDEYRFILHQINHYSKDILQQEELTPHIRAESLGSLLSEEQHMRLEEQYLSNKEKEVQTWLFNALKLKEADWRANKQPELIDEYYFCPFAFDVIGILDGAIKEVEVILGNDKAQRILLHLGHFLISYKNAIEEILNSEEMKTNIMKAQLFNISNIRAYIENQENLPDEVKVPWLSTVFELRDSCYNFFLRPIHKDLKVIYCKVWTPDWFSGHDKIIDKLEDLLNEKIYCLKGLHDVCRKELLSQLHFEVMIEYVRRMLKRKLKLKNKDKQQAAAHLLCQDSEKINTLFDQNGSENRWLAEILPRVSEVIKEQDPENLELEICVLLKQHPDLSKHQVRQLMQLKSRCPDEHMIRGCYHQIEKMENLEQTPAFFCHVPKNSSFCFSSCFCILPFCHFNQQLPCRK